MKQHWHLLWLGLFSSSLFFTVSGTTTAAESAITAKGAANDQLLQWYRTKTVVAYRKSSYTNAAWNDAVEKALELYSQTAAMPSEHPSDDRKKLLEHLQEALDAGCNDPLLRYMQLHYMPESAGKTPDKIIATWVQAAERLDKSRHYTSTHKFRANLRAWNVWLSHNTRPSQPPPHYGDALNCYNRAYGYVKKIINDTNTPPEIAYQVCSSMMDLFRPDKKNNSMKVFYDSIKDDLARRFPDSARLSMLRGRFYIDYAGQARGTGPADTVSEENGRLYMERLLVAEEALEKAWRLDPTIAAIPIEMMNAMRGLGPNRPRLEMWFQRAMKLDPNSYSACHTKVDYISARWYGSTDEAVAFGRECVNSTQWGGDVPWILFDAHRIAADSLLDPDARTVYWRQPSVWPDLKKSFEKCLLTTPNNTVRIRQAYVYYADACGQWKEMNRQLALLTKTNFAYFGGAAAFKAMIERGATPTNNSPASPK